MIWVLESGSLGGEGTAESCRSTLDFLGSESGWCVGDSETQPEPGTFDESPFSVGRGFDIIVTRDDMRIGYATSHGTPNGNENLDGEAILEAVETIISGN